MAAARDDTFEPSYDSGLIPDSNRISDSSNLADLIKKHSKVGFWSFQELEMVVSTVEAMNRHFTKFLVTQSHTFIIVLWLSLPVLVYVS